MVLENSNGAEASEGIGNIPTGRTVSATASDEDGENSLDLSTSAPPEEEAETKTRPPLTMEDKKLNRILANRKSARKSRERRKKLQEDLEYTVMTLTQQNNDLLQQNDNLKKQVALLSNILNQQQQTNSPQVPPGMMPTSTSTQVPSMPAGTRGGVEPNPFFGAPTQLTQMNPYRRNQNLNDLNLLHAATARTNDDQQSPPGGISNLDVLGGGAASNVARMDFMRTMAVNNAMQQQQGNGLGMGGRNVDMITAMLESSRHPTHQQEHQQHQPL